MASSMDSMQLSHFWNTEPIGPFSTHSRQQSKAASIQSARGSNTNVHNEFAQIVEQNNRNNAWNKTLSPESHNLDWSYPQKTLSHPRNALTQDLPDPFLSPPYLDRDNRSTSWPNRVLSTTPNSGAERLGPSSRALPSSVNPSLPPSRDGHSGRSSALGNAFADAFGERPNSSSFRPAVRQPHDSLWENQMATLSLYDKSRRTSQHTLIHSTEDTNTFSPERVAQQTQYQPLSSDVIWGMQGKQDRIHSMQSSPLLSKTAMATTKQHQSFSSFDAVSKPSNPVRAPPFQPQSMLPGLQYSARTSVNGNSALSSHEGPRHFSVPLLQTPGALPYPGIGSQYSNGFPQDSPESATFPNFGQFGTFPYGTPMAAQPFYPVTPASNLRSVRLDQFINTPKSNRQKWTLQAIFDYAHEFSTNQDGSRFVQERLDTATNEEKEEIFCELEREAMTLMKDVFGNYVMQKYFDIGTHEQRSRLVEQMRGHVLQLSKQQYGCRVVQKALDEIFLEQKIELLGELHNHVLECVQDQNGNHVIQKAIQCIPQNRIGFIFNTFNGQIAKWAVHSYGCRVVQRMLEHYEGEQRASVLRELHACIPNLIDNSMGNYVAQHIIEYGSLDDRAAFAEYIRHDFPKYASNKHASNVVEKCLKFGTNEQRRGIMLRAVERNARGETLLSHLIRHSYGNYVIQQLLDTLQSPDFDHFVDHLRPEVVRAKRQGTSIKQLQKIEEKMRRRGGVAPAELLLQQGDAQLPPPLVQDGMTPTTGSRPSTASTTVYEGAPPPPSQQLLPGPQRCFSKLADGGVFLAT